MLLQKRVVLHGIIFVVVVVVVVAASAAAAAAAVVVVVLVARGFFHYNTQLFWSLLLHDHKLMDFNSMSANNPVIKMGATCNSRNNIKVQILKVLRELQVVPIFITGLSADCPRYIKHRIYAPTNAESHVEGRCVTCRSLTRVCHPNFVQNPRKYA